MAKSSSAVPRAVRNLKPRLLGHGLVAENVTRSSAKRTDLRYQAGSGFAADLRANGAEGGDATPAVASPAYDAFENLTASQARAFETTQLIRRAANDTDTQR